MPIPKSRKYLSWILLGALSVFFAEVISGSDMFPFFHPWGILVVFPLYTLHLLVLARLAYRNGTPSLVTLFAAGAILGLYEAYITKVLWDPPWGAMFKLGGLAPFETALLVLFWHPFMAFILPLLVGEIILTPSQTILNNFPVRAQRFLNSKKGILSLAITAGVFQSINSPTPGHSLISGLSSIGVLLLLWSIWKRWTKEETLRFEALLPNRREFTVLLIALLSMYLGLGMILRPEALPNIYSQFLVWVLYMLFAGMLYFSLKKTNPTSSFHPGEESQLSQGKLWLNAALVFIASAVLSELLLSSHANPIALISLTLMSVMGILVLLWTGRTILLPGVPDRS